MRPYSEFFAAQVAERAGLSHVDYGLEVWKGHLASVCPLFNSKDYAYVPFYEATDCGRLLQALAIAAEDGSGVLEGLLDMLAFDSLIANDDRHAGNYGFLRDNHTGEYVSLTPLFDNNRSLFPTAMPSDYGSFGEMAAQMRPAGSDRSFSYLLRTRFAAAGSHRIAKKLIGFSFSQHPCYHFDEERLAALSSMVQTRASAILDCPTRDVQDIASWLHDSDAAKSIDFERVLLLVQHGLSMKQRSDGKH